MVGAEDVEVKVELISKPEEGLWTSVAWNNGKPRTITGDGADPDDPRFAVQQAKNSDGYLKILGDGTAEIGGKGRILCIQKRCTNSIIKANPIPLESQRWNQL